MKKGILVLLLFTFACSSKADKKDDNVAEESNGTSENVAPSDDFLNKKIEVEEVRSPDNFDGAIEAPGETSIDASVAADLAEAKQLLASGRQDAAASILSGAVDNPSGGFLAAYNLGVIRETQGKYDKAANRYYQALQKNADFTPALENLVRLYLRNGRAADASRLIEKFTNARPENLGHRAVGLQVYSSRRRIKTRSPTRSEFCAKMSGTSAR